jgi:hypothetical protein
MARVEPELLTMRANEPKDRVTLNSENGVLIRKRLAVNDVTAI